MKKTVWTLAVDNYAPEITRLTFPLLRYFAAKIGADFRVITERKFSGYPPPYEKLQLHELGRESDWNIFFDADTLVHPETIDFTEFMSKDTVANNGMDMGAIRWTYDEYFRRDGRNIGTCGWCIIVSNWCLDFWRPLDDLTMEEALANCHPTIPEMNSGVIDVPHLLDDYVMSRNVARFGLKYTTLIDLFKKIGLEGSNFFYHVYLPPEKDPKRATEKPESWKVEKTRLLQETLKKWKIPPELLKPHGE